MLNVKEIILQRYPSILVKVHGFKVLVNVFLSNLCSLVFLGHLKHEQNVCFIQKSIMILVVLLKHLLDLLVFAVFICLCNIGLYFSLVQAKVF